jgi:hypothetical protein
VSGRKIYGCVVASSCEHGVRKRANDNNEMGDATAAVKVDLRYEVLGKAGDFLGQMSRGAGATVMEVIWEMERLDAACCCG